METSEAESEPREITKLKDVWVLSNDSIRWDTEMNDLLILTKDEAEALAAWKQAECDGENTPFRAVSLRQRIDGWVHEGSDQHWDRVRELRMRIFDLDMEKYDLKMTRLAWAIAAIAGWLILLFSKGL
jgi:hypothetical protein